LPFGNEAQDRNEVTYAQAFEAILSHAPVTTSPLRTQCVPRRVCHINAGLTAGGAERQLLNTVAALSISGQCERVFVYAEYLGRKDGLGFFEAALKGHDVTLVRGQVIRCPEEILSLLPVEVVETLVSLGTAFCNEVLALVQTLREIRPEVIHAWQDGTGIRSAMAGLLVGTPKIIISGRNVAPPNFDYLTRYMYPGYRALVQSPQVTLVNNSDAGAHDYSRWLGIKPESITVIRNGVDFASFARATRQEINQYRASLGIPTNAELVGSIFRFSSEKRPFLWVDTAKQILERRSTVYFLILGDGPLREETLSYARACRISHRLICPGVSHDVSLAISSMQCFLIASEFEGTPNAVLEAQYLGCPVVSTDAGGTREAIVDGVTGCIAPAPEASTLAALVESFLSNTDARRKVQTEGPLFVKDRYGIDRMTRETLSLYGFKKS
jgi:glycosyltransferase involved in cell wall biosynthesis